MVGCCQRRLWRFGNNNRRNGKPKINVVTIDGTEVRGKRRQGFRLLGKSLKMLQIVFIIKLSEHGILYTICPIQASPSIPNCPVPPTPLVMSLTIQANPSVLVHSFIMIFQVVLITFNACCSQQRRHGVLSIIGPLALKGGGKRWLRRVMLSMQYLKAGL